MGMGKLYRPVMGDDPQRHLAPASTKKIRKTYKKFDIKLKRAPLPEDAVLNDALSELDYAAMRHFAEI